jgi:hypothetical protein
MVVMVGVVVGIVVGERIDLDTVPSPNQSLD